MATENRMISAEWLKTKCYEICDEYNTDHLYIDRIIDEIDNAPDVEVVHGRWEKSNYHSFLCCSECKDVYIDKTWFGGGKWSYCPNCGAKMDGDGNGG